MEFKQDTIGDILNSEHEMVLRGADNYDEYFINASEFNHLLNDCVKSIDDMSKFVFIAFLFQIKKYHTLALFSAVRRHHIQTSLCLRHVIESGQWAAYAMGNSEQDKFCTTDGNGIITVDKKHESEMYLWLDNNFKIKAEETKQLKKIISSSVVHSNIVYAFQNFGMKDKNNPGFETTFFDAENDFTVKTDLWSVANTAMGLLDLFHGVNQQFKVVRFVDDFLPRLKNLANQNKRLRLEMMQNENYKRSLVI